MKLISWNVNGITSCVKNGLLDFIENENSDFYCFQETKTAKENFPESLFNLKQYKKHFFFSKRKGYSGLCTLSKKKPISIIKGINKRQIDSEARVLTLEFEKFFLINAYFPQARRDLSRLDFKLKFNKHFSEFCKKLENKKPIIIGSDFNVAHKRIDLKNPESNKYNPGFTAQERKWFDTFLKKGYIDTFREKTKEPGKYTWWSYMYNARKRNIGWRLDYFVISQDLKNKVMQSKIQTEVYGSDHCPIKLKIKI